MSIGTRPDVSEDRDLNKIISWFITIRWVASGFVAATVEIARRAFAYELCYVALYVTTGALFLVNSLAAVYFIVIKKRRLEGRSLTAFLHTQILGDYLLLLLLIYFAGFLENPFSTFFVFHVMLTSFLFRSTVVYRYVAGVIFAIVGVLTAEYLGAIPHFSIALESQELYGKLIVPRAAGLCATLVISAYLVTSIKARLEEKGKRVEIERDRYKQLDQIKSNFILQVTHEIRGPIAAVSGFHEMVLRGITGPVSTDTKAVLEKADRRTENLLTIIDEMIDYAYMKSDERNHYRHAVLDVKRAVNELMRAHRSHADDQGVELRIDCPSGLQLIGNRDLINIILGNLINNAIKYSPRGSQVTVTVRRSGGEVHLQVRDTGYGIEPDQIEKIFEEFYRTRRARELERDGTGLGLPIVKRAVETLGGRITVYSELETGTTFHIYLPDSAEQREGEDHEAHPDN